MVSNDDHIIQDNTVAEVDVEAEAPTTSSPGAGDDKAHNNNLNINTPNNRCSCSSHGRSCGNFLSYNNNADASGYSWLGAGRGALIMSNQFLVSSMLYLASQEATCTPTPEEIVADATCTPKVHGFTPAGLITNIAIISGLLSAFCMPVLGAVVDFTPYRRMVGIVAAVLLTLIQAVQIYTVEDTWFPMAILQAIAGFIYNIEIVAAFAYLPDISRVVGQATMTSYSSRFTLIQYASQFVFLVIVIGISWGLQTSNVVTAQISQGLNTVWIAILFGWGWKLMSKRPANHTLPDGHWLVTEGFRQNFITAKNINRHYKRGLRWFLLAAVFAGGSSTSMSTVAVVYLQSLGMNSRQIGIFFLVFLVSTTPGTQLGAFITSRTNPNHSWQLSMVAITIILIVGSLSLDGLPPEKMFWSYIWGVFIGLGMGWFFPAENLFFSMCLPKGQEAELAGFFVYCTQILAWLPPLIFTVLVENNVAEKWGVIALSIGFVVAVCLLMLTAPWNEIIEEAMCGDNLIQHQQGQVREEEGETGDIKAEDDDEDDEEKTP